MPLVSGGGGGGGLPSQWTVDAGGNLRIAPTNDANDALDLDDSTGVALFHAIGGGATATLHFVDSGIEMRESNARLFVYGKAQIGGGSYDDAARLEVLARSTAAGGQTQPLLRLRDADLNIVGGALASGAYVTRVHAAPADGDLASGELALWFDQTNGAAKLMLKGKTANGTVVTASVAMA